MSRFYAKLFTILTWIAAVILVLIFAANESKAGIIITAVVSCAVVMTLAHFLRCPCCGRGPGRDWLFAEYCPYCGEYLDD